MASVRISITVPKEEFTFIEEERKRKKTNRSQVIQEAINLFYKNKLSRKLTNKYITGYQQKPEKPISGKLMKIQFNTFEEY
ncbi:MAG: ribbon-helix-helix domain-containing protein [Elusimicrobia bacterium]|nr:ribbon-helix-helix domain-containing protein [Patescibacteria group bacterium]MBU2568299.1 ribbon-helix-helix domain-containing protein [Elusimicrobiota bacterium]